MVTRNSLSWALAAGLVAASAQITRAQQDAHFDYIVVGGGTAGCALAARLCEGMPGATVAVLERGLERTEEQEFHVRSPLNMDEAWNDFGVVDAWDSEPNEGLMNDTVQIITGYTLGGGSSVNGAQWTTPVKGDVEQWGIEGLDQARADELYARALNKLGGDVPPLELQQPYSEDWLDAGEKVGVARGNWSSGAVENAAWQNVLAADQLGRRVDSCTGYLTPALEGACANTLSLYQGITTTRLIFNGNKATGVELVSTTDTDLTYRNGLYAAKEVIVSAGPYGSPQLLQLSGIGPAAVLAAADVTQIAELPVGQRSQARPGILARARYDGKPLAAISDPAEHTEAARAAWEAGETSIYGVGSAAINGHVELNGYFTTSVKAADVSGAVKLYKAFCLTNTESFGSISIVDSNPFSRPSVNLNLLADQADVGNMQRCLQWLKDILQAFPDDFDMLLLAPSAEDTIDEEYVRERATNGDHFVGGCAVGSVTGADFKVKGFSGLRVVDASAIPRLPTSAGPASSVYMIAELAAELIIAENSGTSSTSPAVTAADASTAAATADRGFTATVAKAAAAAVTALS